MDNPLEQPVSDDPITRVHEYARDLAWGVAHGKWGTGLNNVGSKSDPFHRIASPANAFDISSRNHWIAVEIEKAEYYELAIVKLLNTLGYSTL